MNLRAQGKCITQYYSERGEEWLDTRRHLDSRKLTVYLTCKLTKSVIFWIELHVSRGLRKLLTNTPWYIRMTSHMRFPNSQIWREHEQYLQTAEVITNAIDYNIRQIARRTWAELHKSKLVTANFCRGQILLAITTCHKFRSVGNGCCRVIDGLR